MTAASVVAASEPGRSSAAASEGREPTAPTGTVCATAERRRAARAYTNAAAKPTKTMQAATVMAEAKPLAQAYPAWSPAASEPAWTELMTPVNRAGPTQAAICTNVVISATPKGFCWGGSVRRPAVCEGENTRPMPA